MTAAVMEVTLDGGAIVLFAVGIVAIVVLLAIRPVPTFGTKCFCPACAEDLVGSDSYDGVNPEILTPQGHLAETYRCATCGAFSAWDFDMYPIPVMLYFRIDGGELDLDEIRSEGADSDAFQEDPDGR